MDARIRTGLLIAALLVGCGDDQAPARIERSADTGDAGPNAGSSAPPPGMPDAGLMDDDAGAVKDAAPTEAPDAASPPAGPNCQTGEVSCDGECIPEIAPTITDLHARIIERGCALSASCHAGVRPKEGLDLTTPRGLLASVDRASAQKPSVALIVPGEPDRSYLIHKLRGEGIAASSSTGAAATRMPPPPTDSLCEEKIRALEAWIAAGARED